MHTIKLLKLIENQIPDGPKSEKFLNINIMGNLTTHNLPTSIAMEYLVLPEP